MDIHNSQFGSEIEYKSLDIGTPAWAVKKGPGAIAPIPLVPGSVDDSEDFEGVPWSSIFLVSNSGWFVTAADSHSPTHSYQSAAGAGPQVSEFIIEDFTFSAQISFWIHAGGFTPSAGDKFEVLFDGVPVYTVTADISTWTRIAIPTNSAFDISFRATQNFPFSGYFVRIDDVVFGSLDTPGVPGSPAHPLVYSPLNLDDNGNLKVSLLGGSVSVTGGLMLSLDCETDSITVCPGDDPLIVNIEGVTPVSGQLPVIFSGSAKVSAISLTNIADSGTSVVLSLPNPNRVGWFCFNDSTEPMFIKFGATASRNSFTVLLKCGAFYEMPTPIYTGVIDAIWNATSGGFARVTEEI